MHARFKCPLSGTLCGGSGRAASSFHGAVTFRTHAAATVTVTSRQPQWVGRGVLTDLDPGGVWHVAG